MYTNFNNYSFLLQQHILEKVKSSNSTYEMIIHKSNFKYVGRNHTIYKFKNMSRNVHSLDFKHRTRH